MSKMRDIAQEILQRIDALAKKLGIAAEQIWAFTVRAKNVQARRDIAQAAFFALVGLALLAWPIHVSNMKLQHETKTERFQKCLVDQHGWGNCEEMQGADIETSHLTDHAMAYVISALIVLLVGLIMAIGAVSEVIAAVARLQTAEYDAYQDLLGDFLE